MNEALLAIIDQEPLYVETCETICPKCDSTNIKTLENMATLVGGSVDTNHYWLVSFCRDCELNFTHEHKKNNHWYTEQIEGVGNFVIKGVSNCFERYVYTCNKCPGYVKRYYTELDGITPLKNDWLISGPNEEGMWAPQQREFWGCVVCKNKTETTEPAREIKPNRLEGWTITTEHSESLYDEEVVSKIIPLVRTLSPSNYKKWTITSEE
jgi:hypothetical protein